MTDRFSEYFNTFADQLARIEHEQWKSWATELLASEESLSEERKERWTKLIGMDWDDLTENDKNTDLLWVSQVLSIFEHDPFLSFVNILEFLLATRYAEGYVGEEVYDPQGLTDRDVGVQLIETARSLIKDIRTVEDKKKAEK
ncbi:hypothetical protein LCGC14_1113210 [marine sediment metagenome]|uniref:Uncharacterized protein n=1 Tax=marine sediment metagenome TaxID=412755 RepID=A0A0F9M652_9ZZZZ